MPTFNVAAPINKAELEHLTMKLRDVFGCSELKFLPVPQVIELVLPKLLGNDFTFRVSDRSEMGDNHGFAEPDHNELVLRDDVYSGMIRGVGRDRMTAIHEVAHLFLHTKKRLFRSMLTEPPKPWQDPEWQAKCFAGMMMMPSKLLRGYSNTKKVAADFGVSESAAAHRLRQLR